MSLKIGNVIVNGPKRGLLVLPREPEPLVFRFVSISDTTGFDLVAPEPEPRKSYDVKTQKHIILVEEPAYKKKVADRQLAFQDWLFLQSIKPSNIEWVTVDLNDPATFGNWRQDFINAGLNNSEANAIYLKYREVQILTQEIIDDAQRNFLASQAVEALHGQQSQTSENLSTESGELVKG